MALGGLLGEPATAAVPVRSGPVTTRPAPTLKERSSLARTARPPLPWALLRFSMLSRSVMDKRRFVTRRLSHGPYRSV